jgi:hypothetical protein
MSAGKDNARVRTLKPENWQNSMNCCFCAGAFNNRAASGLPPPKNMPAKHAAPQRREKDVSRNAVNFSGHGRQSVNGIRLIARHSHECERLDRYDELPASLLPSTGGRISSNILRQALPEAGARRRFHED